MADDDAAAALDRLRSEFEDFLHHLPDAVLEADPANGVVLSMTLAACRLLGYDPGDPPRRLPLAHLVTAPALDLLLEHATQATSDAADEPFDVRMRRCDGSELSAEVHIRSSRGSAIARWVVRERAGGRMAAPEGLGTQLHLCAWCKSIRDDGGQWHQLEAFLHRELGYEFSHGICRECERRVDVSRGGAK